jgi:hypothetical protein
MLISLSTAVVVAVLVAAFVDVGVASACGTSSQKLTVTVVGSQTYGGSPTFNYTTSPSGVTVTSVSCTEVSTATTIVPTLAVSGSPYTIVGSSCKGSAPSGYTVTFEGGAFTVLPAPTGTSVTNSTLPTSLPGSVTFTATVTGLLLTPATSGGITWSFTSSPVSSCTSTTALSLSGGTETATCTVSGSGVLVDGQYVVKASFGEDSNYLPSSGTDTVSLEISSTQGPTNYVTNYVPGPTVTVPGPTITVTVPAVGGPPIKLKKSGKVEPEAFAFAVGPWTLFSHKTVHLKVHLWGRRGTVTGTTKLVFRNKTLCTLKLVKGRGRCTVSSAKFGKGRHKLLINYPGSSNYLALKHLVNVYVHR